MVGTFVADAPLLDGRGRYVGPAGDVVAPWADRVVVEPADGDGMLIRPDGYLAWAGADPNEPRAALSRWFGS